jgi:hypothetical protein
MIQQPIDTDDMCLQVPSSSLYLVSSYSAAVRTPVCASTIGLENQANASSTFADVLKKMSNATNSCPGPGRPRSGSSHNRGHHHHRASRPSPHQLRCKNAAGTTVVLDHEPRSASFTCKSTPALTPFGDAGGCGHGPVLGLGCCVGAVPN